jgi:hypothetical protein
MSTRLDLVIQKFPDHEAGIRTLASRDPSGNFKYLDWGAKVLVSGQALAPEIADVIEMFHQFSGRTGRARRNLIQTGRTRDNLVRSDIYSYRPQDLASLRDTLLKIKRAADRKRRERERLYKLEGEIEADVVYDSPDLIVRHIKNKAASCHYGLSTKWCIAMRREAYFEDYESNNATFFFFERKAKKGDEFDKMALMVPRNAADGLSIDAFTSLDRRVDMLSLAKVHGTRVFDIFREIYERSEKYPGSAMTQVYKGQASAEVLQAVFDTVVKGRFKKDGLSQYELEHTLEAICCNDAAPWSLLEQVQHRARSIVHKAGRTTVRRRKFLDANTRNTIAAALVIHPQVPDDVREKLVKELKRRHIRLDEIRRVNEADGRIGVVYERGHGVYGRRFRRGRFRRFRKSPNKMREHAAVLVRRAARLRKSAARLERKLKEAAEKKAKREAAREAAKNKKMTKKLKSSSKSRRRS